MVLKASYKITCFLRVCDTIKAFKMLFFELVQEYISLKFVIEKKLHLFTRSKLPAKFLLIKNVQQFTWIIVGMV